MTNDERNPKLECRTRVGSVIGRFVIQISGFLRTENRGSWRAHFRFCACIGTLNRLASPSPVLRTPSPPLGERDRVRGYGSWKALFRFFECIGTLNPPPAPPWRGGYQLATSPPGRGQGWVGLRQVHGEPEERRCCSPSQLLPQ